MIRYGVVQEKVADKENEQQPDTKPTPLTEESVSDTDSKTTSSQVKETDK